MIDFNSSTKKATNLVFTNSTLNSLLGNSLSLGITISLLMVLLVMVMYPAKAGTSFSIMVKLFIYMFLGSTIFIFLHDGIMHNNILNEVKDSKGDELFSSMNEKNRQESSADIVYGEKKVSANVNIKEDEPPKVIPTEEKKEITGGVRLTTKHNSLYKSPFTL
jgi:hypothetical protein